MKLTYEVIETALGSTIKVTDSDGKIGYIPEDLANSDYQRYLRWLNGEEEPSGTL